MSTVDKPAAAAKATLPASLRVSNPDRVIDAESGTTKIDTGALLRAGRAADDAAPEGQAGCLAAAPQGLAGELFFQKHAERYKMPGVEQLDPGHRPGSPALARGRVA